VEPVRPPQSVSALAHPSGGFAMLACQEGTAGFLAGRAVWRSCIGRPDVESALRVEAVARLQRLAEIVSEAP
jgi:tagatose-1,6-bisphosphate aldolase